MLMSVPHRPAISLSLFSSCSLHLPSKTRLSCAFQPAWVETLVLLSAAVCPYHSVLCPLGNAGWSQDPKLETKTPFVLKLYSLILSSIVFNQDSSGCSQFYIHLWVETQSVLAWTEVNVIAIGFFGKYFNRNTWFISLLLKMTLRFWHLSAF